MHPFDTLSHYMNADRMRPPETRVNCLFRETTPCAPAIPPEAARIVAIATADMPADGASGMPVPGGADHARCPEGRADVVDADPADAMAAGIRRGSRHRDVRPPGRRSPTPRVGCAAAGWICRGDPTGARGTCLGAGPRGRLPALMTCFEAARPTG